MTGDCAGFSICDDTGPDMRAELGGGVRGGHLPLFCGTVCMPLAHGHIIMYVCSGIVVVGT